MANETNETKYDIELDEDTQAKLDGNREADLNEVDNMYGAYDEATGTFKGGIGGQIDTVTNQQIQNIGNYAEQQKQNQQDSYNQQKAEINQQKEQAGKDYIKEGAGAYADYQKAINPYGVNAERMAEQGHTGSGVAESSRITMYTTYQNRVATARKVYSDAVVNFNNMIEQARIANNSAIAQIGFQAMQSQLEISMNALNKKGELVDKIASQKVAINTRHDNIYRDALDHLYRETALNEERRQADQAQSNWREQFDWQKDVDLRDFNESVRQFGENLKQRVAEFDWQKAFEETKFNWQKQTDERDYNRGVTESDRNYGLQQQQVNATIQKQAREEIFNLVNNGAGATITDEMLTNAGMSRATADALIVTYNELKTTSTSNDQWAMRQDLFASCANGKMPSEEEFAKAGITTEADKQTFIDLANLAQGNGTPKIDKNNNSSNTGSTKGTSTDNEDWDTVTNAIGMPLDAGAREMLIDAGILSKTQVGGKYVGNIANEKGMEYILKAVGNEHTLKEALDYYNIPLVDRVQGAMELVDDGGFNTRWLLDKDSDNMDTDAKVKDLMGVEWTIQDLYDALKDSGLSKDEAKKKILAMQTRLGITKDHGGWDWWNELWGIS